MSRDSRTLETTDGDTPELAETVAAHGTARKRSEDRTQIGRYRVVRRLGEGGMGVVWEAVDPELGRGVAIKVLHEARGASLGLADRLRREAQSLAKLSHPNVVSVYDMGVDDGELYIVMQLVDGVTLDVALAERKKSTSEIIELLLQAGRGLEAAHAAGIVHRDFKPTNILVGADGVVRVTDFGLARASEAAEEVSGGELDVSMTRGAMVGTPAYMAPEQFRAGPVTAATDQFAFCVTLWEALWGQRPFEGRSVDTIRAAVLAGKRREMPQIPRASRRIRTAVARGLSVDPAARFGSMSELLALIAPPNRTRLFAGLGAAALVTSIVLISTVTTTQDPCATAPLPANAVWNPDRVDAVRAAFASAKLPDPTAILNDVIGRLDDRTRAWRAARLDTCQATKVRDEQTADMMQKRYRCLDQSLVDERAAIEVLSGTVDRELMAHARDIAASGRLPEECGPERIGEHGPAMTDPNSEELYAEVARYAALGQAGRHREVVAASATMSARVDAMNHAPVAMSWYWSLGESARFLGDPAQAKAAFRKCAQAATVAGDDRLAARAWSSLAEVASAAGDLKGVDDLIAAARGAAIRSGDRHADIDVDEAMAIVALDRGDFTQAIALCQGALDKASKVAGPETQTAFEALACLFNAQQPADPKAAVATGQRAVELATRIHGATHPITIDITMHLATAKETIGDAEGARPLWDRALAADSELFGADSVPVMNLLHDKAVAQSPQGVKSTPEALEAIQRAVAISDKILAPKDPQRAAMLEALALVESTLQHFDAANAAYARTIAQYEQLDDPMGLTRVLYNAGDALQQTGHCDRALPLFRRATKVASDTGQKTRVEAACLGAIAACLDQAGNHAEGDDAFSRAIATLDELGDPLFGAQTRWNFADSLVKRHQRDRALEIARKAADELAGAPPPAADLRKQILDWIAKQ